MADTKISALTAVVTPASTDEFAVNQGGTSKKQTRAQVHTLESGEKLVLPQDNDATSPTIQFGDGNSGFYESSDNIISVATIGGERWRFDGTVFLAAGSEAQRPRINGGAIGNTDPTYTFAADNNTGITGGVVLDNLDMICGGTLAARFEDTADLSAGETSLYLYDADNATLEKVTVGAADSGGAGFKVLRIPN